jgi:glycine/D-amino acid oxidase-like deaminating enzyme
VETTAGDIKAPIVINAAGPWAPQLAKTTGMDLPICAVRHSIATLRVPNASRWPPLVPYAERTAGFYTRPHTDDLCFVGSLDPLDRQKADPDHYSTSMSDAFGQRNRERSARRLSRFTGAEIVGGWASLFDTTPDDNPIVGQNPDVRGSFIIAGLSGHGFKFCLMLGQAVADLVLNGTTEVELGPFALERFADADRSKPLCAPSERINSDTRKGA